MNDSLVAVLILGFVNAVLFRVLWTAPRWLVRDFYGLRLSVLRDQITLDLLSGTLPTSNASVRQLVSRIDIARQHYDSPLFRELIISHQISKKMSLGLRSEYENAAVMDAIQGFDEGQAKRFIQYRERYFLLFAGSVITGSWLGLVSVAVQLPWVVTTSFVKRSTSKPATAAKSVDCAVERVSNGRFHRYFDNSSEGLLADYEEEWDSDPADRLTAIA